MRLCVSQGQAKLAPFQPPAIVTRGTCQLTVAAFASASAGPGALGSASGEGAAAAPIACPTRFTDRMSLSRRQREKSPGSGQSPLRASACPETADGSRKCRRP